MYMLDTTHSYNEKHLYYLGTYCSAVDAAGPMLMYLVSASNSSIQTMAIAYVIKYIMKSILYFDKVNSIRHTIGHQ